MRVLIVIGVWIVWIFGGADLLAGSLFMLWALTHRDAMAMLLGLAVATMAACMIRAVTEVRRSMRPP